MKDDTTTSTTPPVGIATKSILVTAGLAFAAAVANALAGGPVQDTITAASTGTLTLITMAVGRYGQAIALHGLPGTVIKVVDQILERKLKDMIAHPPTLPAPTSTTSPGAGQTTPSVPPIPPPAKSAVQEAADQAKDKLKHR